MPINRNNHVFKGHKTMLGSKYVTYGEVELPLRYDLFSKSSTGFDWGHNGPAAMQLSFSILCQISNKEIAKNHVVQFNTDIVKHFSSRDWVLNANDVIEWLEEHEESLQEDGPALVESTKRMKKLKSKKDNIVKSICKELEITQKQLAEILEVPEGTVSSWAVKNEIPRLGKKAIEFYTQNTKNQQIVNSYKNFIDLLQAS